MPDDTTRFYVERLTRVSTIDTNTNPVFTDYVDAWLPVGHIDMDRPSSSHHDAFTAWVGEQATPPPLGYYRILERGSVDSSLFGVEFEIREHRERVIEPVEHPQVARDIETLSQAAMTPAPGSDAAPAGKRA